MDPAPPAAGIADTFFPLTLNLRQEKLNRFYMIVKNGPSERQIWDMHSPASTQALVYGHTSFKKSCPV